MIVELCNAALSKTPNLDVSRFMQTVPRNIITGFKVSRCGSEVHLEVVAGREDIAYKLWDRFILCEESKCNFRIGVDFTFTNLSYLPALDYRTDGEVYGNDLDSVIRSQLPEETVLNLQDLHGQEFSRELRKLEGFLGYVNTPYPTAWFEGQNVPRECVGKIDRRKVVLNRSIMSRTLVYGETLRQFEERARESVYRNWQSRLNDKGEERWA